MSASRNAAANANQPGQQTGQFGSHKPRDEPMTTHGHKPGVKASPNDDVPEFSAKTLPPGSAPADRSFKPNNISEIPTKGAVSDEEADAGEDEMAQVGNASDSLGMTTSASVHTGLGKPVQGQSSQELRHDGQSGRKKQSAGLHGVGASGAAATAGQEDGRDLARQRALDKDEAVTGGTKGEVGAEEQPPVSAGEVADEQKRPRNKHLDAGSS
ncbi:MAG: hypothetical protein M1812_002363 [Candelaria pacifica]|nr:MAG: hypothetical protein M1812_002363 [Candelaria pacifica]